MIHAKEFFKIAVISGLIVTLLVVVSKSWDGGVDEDHKRDSGVPRPTQGEVAVGEDGLEKIGEGNGRIEVVEVAQWPNQEEGTVELTVRVLCSEVKSAPPAAGAEVFLVDSDGKEKFSILTSAEGTAIIPLPKSGNFEVGARLGELNVAKKIRAEKLPPEGLTLCLPNYCSVEVELVGIPLPFAWQTHLLLPSNEDSNTRFGEIGGFLKSKEKKCWVSKVKVPAYKMFGIRILDDIGGEFARHPSLFILEPGESVTWKVDAKEGLNSEGFLTINFAWRDKASGNKETPNLSHQLIVDFYDKDMSPLKTESIIGQFPLELKIAGTNPDIANIRVYGETIAPQTIDLRESWIGTNSKGGTDLLPLNVGLDPTAIVRLRGEKSRLSNWVDGKLFCVAKIDGVLSSVWRSEENGEVYLRGLGSDCRGLLSESRFVRIEGIRNGEEILVEIESKSSVGMVQAELEILIHGERAKRINVLANYKGEVVGRVTIASVYPGGEGRFIGLMNVPLEDLSFQVEMEDGQIFDPSTRVGNSRNSLTPKWILDVHN